MHTVRSAHTLYIILNAYQVFRPPSPLICFKDLQQNEFLWAYPIRQKPFPSCIWCLCVNWFKSQGAAKQVNSYVLRRCMHCLGRNVQKRTEPEYLCNSGAEPDATLHLTSWAKQQQQQQHKTLTSYIEDNISKAGPTQAKGKFLDVLFLVTWCYCMMSMQA